MLTDAQSQNFQTICEAIANGDVALVECQDRATGQPVAVICTLHMEDGEVKITPFARMFEGNPFEQLNPPDDNGGFRTETPA